MKCESASVIGMEKLMSSQIVNLRNIIEVNNKELPTYPHAPPVGLGRIQEEGDGRPDMVGHLLGKRPRIE